MAKLKPTKPLTYSEEAQALLTPFRAEALETIYNAAKAELGPSFKSAYVFTWSQQGESDSTTFVLNISSNNRWEELKHVQKTILNKIAEESVKWTDEEKEDYSRMIYFELEPVD